MSLSTAPAPQPAGGPPDAGGGPEGSPLKRLFAFSSLNAAKLGSLQVVIGLVVIWTVFALAHDRFLTATNLTNLALQIAAVGTISIGVVLVLLLGEIDLSIGSVSGLCAGIMAVLNVKHGLDPVLAIVLALLAGAAIGLLQGAIVTAFGVPSFVVTLGGLIAWQGAQLMVLGDTGSINVTDPTITGLTSTFYPAEVGWALAAAGLAVAVVATVRSRRSRTAAGLPVGAVAWDVVRIALPAAVGVAALLMFGSARGVPLSVLIFLGLVIAMDLVCRRTLFGRHLFAIGGNAKAARRVGIKVKRIRLLVFVLASTFAAAGGILAASRLLAVNQASGSGDVLLNAIAGAVIGGTSLFGGRGSVWSALLGALVIGSVSNGMDLLALESSVKFMVTGAVLVLAVVIDATTNRRRDDA
ncbi:sugar ABC transporter permease [Conexibacter arvalis]|uniref:Xylose transport system permease protein XylH n=1 Tax=Conexibacter arvalis TaxID=912552 RepID=A0A840I9E3_9ACTN|nr:sugar ABC transporter permease [Conexibacter arvalis]MBB4660853.1 D-xylose transport system permease protein [Conexibacter arvalis]